MIALIGLLLGVFLGLVFDVNIPESFSPYMSVAILACLDSVFGAFRASLNNNFKSDIFNIRIFWKCFACSRISISWR